MKMKKSLALAFSLLTLGGMQPLLVEAAPAAETAAVLPAPVVTPPPYYYQMSDSFELMVDFPVPMVPAEEVGKPVKPGVVKVSHADDVALEWLSTSRLRVKPLRDLPVLEVFTLEVPEGVKGLNGEAIPPLVKKLGTSRHFYGYSTGKCDNGDIFLRADEAQYADILQSRLGGLFIEMGDKRYPVTSRPATVADALAHWWAFKSCMGHRVGEEERAVAAGLPKDEELPHTWLLEVPAVVPGGSFSVYMPHLRWEEKGESFVPSNIVFQLAREWKHEITNICKAPGKYELELQLDMPAAACTPEELLRQFEWGLALADTKDTESCQKMEWRDGALRAMVKGKEVVIAPQKMHLQEVRMLGGSLKQCCSGMTLLADTGGLELKLRSVGMYEGVLPFDEDKRPEVSEDVTVLRPRAPYIYTDVCASQLQLRGSTTIRCRYGRVKGGKIRLWKLRGEAKDAVRLLSDYGTRYTGERLDWDDEEARESARVEAKLDDEDLEGNCIDSDELPGVLAAVERELPASPDSEISLPLAELFPGQPVGGFYMVEVEGEPMRRSETPCMNQGLVQVTDLGLLWKTNGRHLFGWAYHLSTADEVQEARLRLLDAGGDTLGELPVKDGLVQGEFPAATRYLQLCTADDSVILRHEPRKMDWAVNHGDTWKNKMLMEGGICPADLPEPLVYLFSDRSLYRPGEKAHVKGLIRWVKNNEILLPEVEKITAELYCNSEKVTTLPVKLEENGSFTVEAPMNAVGNYTVTFRLEYKGDEQETSPDKAVLKGKEVQMLNLGRAASISLPCKEFRRNEFEVESSLNIDVARGLAKVEAKATNLTTTPVARGKVEWRLVYEPSNFHPRQPQWQGFRFGDYTENPWGYYRGIAHGGERHSDTQSSTLDDAGQGGVSFTLPNPDKPRTLRVVSTATVTNGNELSVKSVQEQMVHPAGVYGGIRPKSILAPVGGTMPVELVAVRPDGSAWDGQPLAAEVTVKRTVFHPYRYGSVFKSAIRNAADENTQRKIPVQLTGTPQKLEIPVEGAGRYDVELRGCDAEGRKFYSATRHYVWGSDVSPWEYIGDTGLNLLPDKDSYQPGETACVLVQTPVDAELLVTVERGKVLRHLRRQVTVDNPVIEVPLEAADAPGVYVSVSLVQNAGARGADGKPLLKMGTCLVRVEAVEKKLKVQLQASQKSLLPGEPCQVSGVITDAAGKPVAGAEVTLFAEDEGTLQVMGYNLPDPGRYFYSMESRDHCVGTFSGLGQLVSENLGSRYFGNKGVFIGGGGDDMEMEEDVSDEAASCLRRNFNPCALWLSSVKTDAQGRFSATYANPDTLTRYRLMAVAAAGDKFGSGEAGYHVTKPVMLEPVAPMSATEGDELLLPVTLSMLPAELPEAANGAPIRWIVTMGGQNVQLPQRRQTVTLQGDAPVTVHFPVKVNRTGPVKLQWVVQAESAPEGGMLARCSDGVQLSFEAVPPMPYIRENFSAVIQPGQTGNLGQWMRGDYRPDTKVEVSFTTNPLGGIGYPLQYLFTYPYGCSEQLCSTAIPWIFHQELQTALGISFPEGKNVAEVLSDVDSRLARRSLKKGRYHDENGGYTYWDDGTEACEFSPYVSMVRLMMGIGNALRDKRDLAKALDAAGSRPYMALVGLALTGNLQPGYLDTVLKRVENQSAPLSAQERWSLALAARVLKHQQAEALKKKALATKAPAIEEYHLPPLRALQCLLAVEEAPKASATAGLLRRYLLDEAGQHSTWRNAWMALCVGRYVKVGNLSKTNALLNGEMVTAATPQQYALLASSTMVPFKVEKNPVYVYGQAEGYLKKVQPTKVVDQGFAVQRRYETLQPDGSWKPAGTFRVGDVVRVTLNSTATSAGRNLRYVVLEDRLPAAFEAVDPELGSQGLPAGVSEESGCLWWQSSAVSHREFLKDRVRVFVDNWGNRGKLEVRYVARVVRSGRVTAPGAKVELMYRPQVHGLSIPQQFEVAPR